MPSPRQAQGHAQEDLAENLLVQRGYRIVERNWRGAGTEIDRIAWHQDHLCFIEVRSRTSHAGGSPEASISMKKRRCLIRGATAYLTRFSPKHQPMVRFDVVAVSTGGLKIIANAFDAEGHP